MALRAVSLYSTRAANGDPNAFFSSATSATLGAPVADAWELGGLADHFRGAGDQSPQILDDRAQSGRRLQLVTEELSPGVRRGERYTFRRWRSALIIVPYSGVIAMLDIEFEGDLDAAIQLLDDTFYRRHTICVDGKPLVDAVVSGVPDPTNRDLLKDTQRDLDAHQFLVLPDLTLIRTSGMRSHVSRRRSSLGAAIDMATVHRLMFRGESSRADRQRIGLPSEANRPPGVLVAVHESVTLVAGFPSHEQYAINTMILSAAQVVSGIARARHIRRGAYESVRDLSVLEAAPGRDVRQRRKELTRLSSRLSLLERDLSFGVQANMDIGVILPFGRVADYHRELTRRLGLPAATEVASHQIERLGRSISAAHEAASGRERDVAERFQLGLAVVAALIVAPSLATGFYGANIRGFPGYDSDSGVAYLAALMAASAGVAVVVALLIGIWARRRR
jgi:hypothetical protein